MIDWSKPIVMSDGRKARYVGQFNGGTHYSRVIAIEEVYGDRVEEEIDTCTEDGLTVFSDPDFAHVLNVEEVSFLTVYPDTGVNIYRRTLEAAAGDSYRRVPGFVLKLTGSEGQPKKIEVVEQWY